MQKLWSDKAWEDYLFWQTQDKKTLKKINALIKEIDRTPFKGTGKPEQLTGNRSGFWSRRIDDQNRLMYSIENGSLYIALCRGHYDDK
jgi:toxin YoeB